MVENEEGRVVRALVTQEVEHPAQKLQFTEKIHDATYHAERI